MGNDSTIKVIVIIAAIIIGLLAILLGTSFANVAYYEIGFKQRKSTGYVSTDKVYAMGHHLVGPDYSFKTFKADAHVEKMSTVSIFTSDKLEIWITCMFQYFLRPEELHLLHQNYDIYYEDIIRSNALDALKVAATSYSTDEFIKERAMVEEAMFKAVRERLGGVCCERGCGEPGNVQCAALCTPQSSCKDIQRGLYVSVKFFQMQQLQIPGDVAERYLRTLVLYEEKEKAVHDQNSKLVDQETDRQVEVIRNNAAELTQSATAQADLIRSWAQANATAIVEKARSEGLHNLYSKLGLSEEDFKSSFDYLRTIQQMENAHISVDFNQLITGPVGTN